MPVVVLPETLQLKAVQVYGRMKRRGLLDQTSLDEAGILQALLPRPHAVGRRTAAFYQG